MIHKLMAAAVLLATLPACSLQPLPTDVDELFTKDGCTINRFKDGGQYFYYARCVGATSPKIETEMPK